jgi:hypothetical protein
VLRLIAISSDRPILSVEKELGITPLPLSAEFSPFLIPLMVELVSAGFALARGARSRAFVCRSPMEHVARFPGIA